MITIKEKVSYLKGLAEGMKITDTTNEGKLLLAILDVLEDISYEIEYSQDEQEDVDERLEKLEEDVNYLEDEIFGDDCDCGCDDDCDCGCGCDDCDCNDDEIQYVTIKCPHCQKETSFDVDIFNDKETSVQCPYCHEGIEVTYEDLGEDE